MSRPLPTSAEDAPDQLTAHAWEDTGGEHVWDRAVQEDASGNIVLAAGDTLAQAMRQRRKRMEQNDFAQRNRRIVRDMIRYVYVLIDASRWMRTKDPVVPPGTRIAVTVQMLQDFVHEYFDQNPLSHLGFCILKNGEAETLTPLSSSSKTHKLALESVAIACAGEPPSAGGEFSLQNGLELAGRSLGHQPRHGSREIVVVTAAMSTCDPGYLLTETLPKLQQAKIRVSCFALAAELYICRKLAEDTGGAMGVCLDKAHFRDWLLGQTVPPPTVADRAAGQQKQHDEERQCDMVPMGFPMRTVSEWPALVHATRTKTLLSRTAYTCPQCQAQNAELPGDCAVCSLKLVLAPHLARSFHHLFPVPAFVEVQSVPVNGGSTTIETATSVPSVLLKQQRMTQPVSHDLVVTTCKNDQMCCFACVRPLNEQDDGDEQLRFQCPTCKNVFCVDCDSYLHETLHNCPGCLAM